MDKPSIFYRAWTYWVPVNFFIVLWLDVRERIHLLGGLPIHDPPLWSEEIGPHIKARREFREEAARICKRHELIKYQSLDWMDDEL